MAKSFASRWVLGVLSCLVWVLALGCGPGVGAQEPAPSDSALEEEIRSRFHFNTDPEEQILRLRGEGSLVGPSYRLFGDGRLVRELVDMGSYKALHSAERYLEHEDMVALFQLVVAGDLPEMTREGLRARNGGRALPGLVDGMAMVLEINLLSYHAKDGSELAPFSVQVRMLTPFYVVEKLPEHKEALALVALEEALDGYFPKSALEVFKTELTGKPLGQRGESNP